MHTSDSATPPLRVQAALCLGALGVVYGDIGTSPLYTMNECLINLPHVNRVEGVLGVLSLMFWLLIFEVSLKYLWFVMRADNRGEGGIFALLALSHPKSVAGKRGITFATFLIMVGAALLFGDGVITPAISVLGAAEGFSSFSPAFTHLVVPIAVVILAALFLIQSKGTKALGGIFGPVMLVWFATLAALGAWHIADSPMVFRALNPLLGLLLLIRHPGEAAAVIGSVILTVTGAEALYADMGHFGRRYIAKAWSFVVCPALVLNYFGQGAYAISHPADQTNPFFALAPAGALRLGLVAISIAAAIIASQALITGTYSLTRQAIQLGFFPRLRILHTNAEQAGQIYVPLVNAALAISTIWIVLAFKSSSNLAAAYGLAVTGTMAVTTYAYYRVTRITWRWPAWKSWGLFLLFLSVELVLFTANLEKIPYGGWLPLIIAAGLLTIMHTWKTGRDEIIEKVYSGAITELDLAEIAESKNITRVPGSAVFMVATPKGTPLALLHHLKSNKCLHKTAVLLTILTEDVPSVNDEDRLTLDSLGNGVWRAIGRYGYMESPDVAALVHRIQNQGVPLQLMATTFYFNREMIITGGNARMWEWEKRLYAVLSRNAHPVKDYYKILPTQIIEIGLPVQL
ncbi:Low affinity potassium transport system protein kup [mine drainage metagenome]|uniref:Low affinity potassium transport system protein kup n=1 Tax=mine drainage metagenome TaxID=410659 RepID=A0A1J5R9N2_9ZZZZ